MNLQKIYKLRKNNQTVKIDARLVRNSRFVLDIASEDFDAFLPHRQPGAKIHSQSPQILNYLVALYVKAW